MAQIYRVHSPVRAIERIQGGMDEEGEDGVGWGRELAYNGVGVDQGASHFGLLFHLDIAADLKLSFFVVVIAV